ncbi:unnamed protein product [Caenorhabditis angaria]|uniref:Uncharacterized protein n=1 Tax=Caenorhabditis angaria TaxID=860376 RepID=A0A9P1N3R3_9PELO|nr:unnamed protein product [Caenorhabditis angaria]
MDAIKTLISSLTNRTTRKLYEKNGVNLKNVCLSGYIKVFKNTNDNSALFYHTNPIDLKLIRCYPQSPVCISRRDTVKKSERSTYQTQYYRFGCRRYNYWEFCGNTEKARKSRKFEIYEKSAVFCGANIKDQLLTKYSKKIIDLFEWIFKEKRIANTEFRVETAFISQDNRDIIPSFEEEEYEKNEEELKANQAGVFSIGESMIFSKMDVISAILLIIATLKVIRVFFIGVQPSAPIDMDEHSNTASQQKNLASSFDSKFNDNDEPYIR